MSHTTRMVSESLPVSIQAAAVDGEKQGPPTFSALAYSGDPVSGSTAVPRLDADYVLDLAGMTKARNPKVNLDHKSNQRVGHITNFVNDGKGVTVEGSLSAATAHRDEVAKSAADGYAWEVSIEASLSKPQKIEAGDSATVNGRTVSGPIYIFRKSVLTDIGFVSHGANDGNHVTIAASAAGAIKMNEFEKFVVACGSDPETISDTQRATLQKAFDAVNTPAASTSSGRKTWRTIADEERQESLRIEAITRMGRDALRENPHIHEKINAFVEHAIEAKMSQESAELELLRNMRVSGGFTSRMKKQGPDEKVFTAALCMAAGLTDVEKHFSTATLESVDDHKMRGGFSLQRMLLSVAANNGYSCSPGEKIHTGNIRAVLEACFPSHHARLEGFSTTSLPNILGAVANKVILQGYMEMDSSWRDIATTKPVNNFYTQNHYRMLDSLEYEEVGSGGEIKHGSLGEETYTTAAKTYGKMLGITRNQIINDDLGAFEDIRERLGRGAARKFNTVFWTAFMDNSTFFTTALTNYIEGATTTLLTDGVGYGLAVAQFRKMTSPSADNSKRVGQDLNPSIVLVPPELEANAEIMYRNTNLGQVAGSSANIYANRYRPVVQWRLSNSSFTGNSTTAWYLFGDTVKPMTVTFLNGNQTPIVESTDAEFNTLGILFRGYHDFGCDKGEYLAGIKSKGAA